jgi:drug/metabolite transporter (DMT)-like permease
MGRRLDLLRIVPRPGTATALLLLGAACWGSTFPAAKEGFVIMGLLPFMAWSRIIGFLTLAPLAAGIPATEWRRALPIGTLLGVLLYLAYLFQSLGLERTTATNAGFLTGLYVVGTPLIGALLYRRWPEPRVLGAVTLSTLGLALLSLEGWSFAPGDALVLVSVLFWSLQILLVGRAAHLDPVVLILVELGVASVLHAATTLGDLRIQLLADVWGLLILTGALGTGLGYFVQIIAQRRVHPTRTAIIYTSEPLFAALFSMTWLGERLSGRGWAGAALIVAAMLVAELGAARKPAVETATPI